MRPEAVSLTWPRAPFADEKVDGVAVLRISGPLEHRRGWWFESYEGILSRFEGALQDEEVHGILLAIDSPGGEVSGLQETVRRMRELRDQYGKRVVAYADEEMYSAAYALGTAADEIYLPESGGLGSIGVLGTLCDRTEMMRKAGLRVEVIRSGPRKAEGHPDIPLSDATLERAQERVDALADQFFALVSESRGVSVTDLAELQGGLLYGADAVDQGLANGVSSFADVLASFSDDESRIDTNTGTDILSRIVTPNGDASMNLAALKKKVAQALAKLMAARTASAKKSAAAAYEAATQALSEAKVKSKYKKKTTTVEEEEEADDGGEEEEEEAEEEESEEESEEETSGKDDDKDDDDDEDDDEDEEESAAPKKGKKAAAKSGDDLDSFIRTLTGKKSAAAARGVLQAMADTHKQAAAAVAKVERMSAERRADKLAALIVSGVSAGKLAPGQKAWARTQSIASLKAYLETAPVRFAPRQPPLHGSIVQGNGGDEMPGEDGITQTEREICRVSGVSVEDYKKARASGAKIAKVN
jgi:signal peptide peptidase SppA